MITVAPLRVSDQYIFHSIDDKIMVAITDSTPQRNIVGFMLPDDAAEYVRLRGSMGGIVPSDALDKKG